MKYHMGYRIEDRLSGILDGLAQVACNTTNPIQAQNLEQQYPDRMHLVIWKLDSSMLVRDETLSINRLALQKLRQIPFPVM